MIYLKFLHLYDTWYKKIVFILLLAKSKQNHWRDNFDKRSLNFDKISLENVLTFLRKILLLALTAIV